MLAIDCGATVLVALVNSEPGLRKAGAVALIAASVLFGAGLFRGQWAAADRFGCTFYGEDFVAEYTASRLILSGRGASVYDVGELTEAQDEVLAKAKSSCTGGGVMAYGLVFLVPFFPLTLLPAKLAYYVWTGLTVAFFFLGAWRLARAIGVATWPFWAITLGFFPIVGGLLQGQVHGLQFLALVEFWLAQRRRAERSAGLWLSLQFVKPQFLPFLLLWALWQRRWRLLGWFAGGGVAWLGLTVWLAGGVEGIRNYLHMMGENVVGLNAPIGVPNMVNWRALVAAHVGDDRLLSVGVVGILTLLTVGLVLWSWRRRSSEAARLAPQQFLVVISGTLLIGYDTHAYSLALLLAPAFFFLAEPREIPSKEARPWTLLLDGTLLWASLLVIVDLLLAATMGFGLLVPPSQVWILVLVGIILLGVLAHPTAKGHESVDTLSEALQPASRS